MGWVHAVALVSLLLAAGCTLVIVIDIVAHPQRMWVMNIVWPLTALYAGPLALWAYYRIGRLSTRENVKKTQEGGEKMSTKQKPFWQSAAVATTHCGSGCALGYICAEWFIVFFPFTLLGRTVFAAWFVDYILAFLFGIAFQFFTIKPMQRLSTGAALKAALKADTLSLTSWQVGM